MPNFEMIPYQKTENVISDLKNIIEVAQKQAYQSVNVLLVERNWLIGKRIAEEELQGQERAEYGASVIKKLAKELTTEYGRGFTKSNLYSFYSFYKSYPNIFHSVSGKLDLLSWTHYRVLLQVEDVEARDWYAKEAYDQTWSVRTLQRNVSSQYYYRMLKTQSPLEVETEMKELTSSYQNKLEFIKNPIVAEFLGMQEDTSYLESELEQSIINNLQKFLMELGKGYAFVARQQHIHTEKEDYYIDLVFYNYILKCFVLIDLKTSKITHQDVGQMSFLMKWKTFSITLMNLMRIYLLYHFISCQDLRKNMLQLYFLVKEQMNCLEDTILMHLAIWKRNIESFQKVFVML